MRNEHLSFYLNERHVEISAPPAALTLDLLRNRFSLFGTKEGCREGECGACTVLLGCVESGRPVYRAVPSCLLPAAELTGAHLVTIEGMSVQGPSPLQNAFVEAGATQCGFCTPGFIMSLTGYLLAGRPLSIEGALDSIDGNICRCTGYASIRRAVELLFAKLSLSGRTLGIGELAEKGLLPAFLPEIADRLLASEIGGGSAAIREGNEATHLLDAEVRTVLAGGTDLYIQRAGTLEEQEVIPVSRTGCMGPIEVREKTIRIPAATRVETLRRDPIMNREFPGFEKRLLVFASTIVRNRATLGGNIINASPIG
ncbi:MAG TPA: 2Fe-2S iron-sulfur cluster-binding protein, partial [Spirochaetia bacterium]|nr:2Fe-2S iron-sulfur cluster-binding protein [Spirochaetia bacterium]